MNQTRSLILTTLGGLFLALAGCNQPSDESAAAAPPEPVDAAGEPELESVDQRASYGVGYSVGSNIAQQMDFELDQSALMAGLEDALGGGEPRIDPALLQSALSTLQERAAARASEAAAVNLEAANAFLEENGQRSGVTTTDSGLQYEVLASGDGPKPTAEDSVEVHYHGTLIDGTVFDSSVERGETIEFAVTGVIAGWTEALQLMSVGDKWKLFIPPDLAYGPSDRGRIPPNSALIFEVELISIK